MPGLCFANKLISGGEGLYCDTFEWMVTPLSSKSELENMQREVLEWRLWKTMSSCSKKNFSTVCRVIELRVVS